MRVRVREAARLYWSVVAEQRAAAEYPAESLRRLALRFILVRRAIGTRWNSSSYPPQRHRPLNHGVMRTGEASSPSSLTSHKRSTS